MLSWSVTSISSSCSSVLLLLDLSVLVYLIPDGWICIYFVITSVMWMNPFVIISAVVSFAAFPDVSYLVSFSLSLGFALVKSLWAPGFS